MTEKSDRDEQRRSSASGEASGADAAPARDGDSTAAERERKREPDRDFQALLGESAWMRRLALRLVRNEAEADDVLQEAWLRVLRHPPDRGRPARPWLARVLSNVVNNRWRGERRRAAREESWRRSAGDPSEKRSVEDRSAIAEELTRCLERLSAIHREVVRLRFLEELAPTEIAERLDIPAATARTRLKRALDRLRAELDARHGGDSRRWLLALAAWLGSGEAAAPVVKPRRLTAPRFGPQFVASGLITISAVAVGFIVLGPSAERAPTVSSLVPSLSEATADVALPPPRAAETLPLLLDGADAPTPPAAGFPDVADLAAPADLRLRVVDLATGENLEGVQVYGLTGESLDDYHPGLAPTLPLLAAGRSPLTLDASTLEQAAVERSGSRTLLVGASGHVWWRVSIAPGGGARQVALAHDARLRVDIDGRVPAEGAELWIERVSTKRLVLREPIAGGRVGRALEIGGLAGEPCEVSLVVPGAGRGRVLSRQTVSLERDRLTHCSFEVRPVPPDPKARLSGTLSYPVMGADVRAVELRAVGVEASPLLNQLVVATLGAIEEGGASARVAWSTVPLPLGRYELLVKPFGAVHSFELTDPLGQELELALPVMGVVNLRVLDAATGHPVDPALVRWEPREPPAVPWKKRPHARRTDQPGVYRITTVPGTIRIDASYYLASAPEIYVVGEAEVEVTAGTTHVDVLVQRVPTLKLRFVDGATEIPMHWPSSVHVEPIGHAAWVKTSLLSYLSTIVVERPGRYRVSIGGLKGYEPIAPREVDVHDGASTLVIELESS